VDGELQKRLLGRNEVELVVLFELSVRKTLEGRQCGCRDLTLAFPINASTFRLAQLLPQSVGLMPSQVPFLLIKCIIIAEPCKTMMKCLNAVRRTSYSLDPHGCWIQL
jgi:hypothetical protein